MWCDERSTSTNRFDWSNVKTQVVCCLFEYNTLLLKPIVRYLKRNNSGNSIRILLLQRKNKKIKIFLHKSYFSKNDPQCKFRRVANFDWNFILWFYDFIIFELFFCHVYQPLKESASVLLWFLRWFLKYILRSPCFIDYASAHSLITLPRLSLTSQYNDKEEEQKATKKITST